MSVDILLTRMQAQSLLEHEKKSPADIVKSLGGIQAQDYSGGEWSIGLRIPGSKLADIERAISQKEIVRTWAMRGTLHFLAATNIRWVLELLAPGMIARLGPRYKELGLNDRTFAKTETLLEKSLKGDNQLTRKELVTVLEKNGISCEGQRAAFILHRASLDRIICFGVKRDKQETHALFEEWVAATKPMRREDALGELALRYFKSHGPATMQDYMWWSGLRAPDANVGLEAVRSELDRVQVDDRTFWLPRRKPTVRPKPPIVRLLPPFDSYLLGYRDRSACIEAAVAKQLRTGGMPDATIMIDGKITGKWVRKLGKDSVAVTVKTFRKLSNEEDGALEKSVYRYGEFVEKKSDLTRQRISGSVSV